MSKFSKELRKQNPDRITSFDLKALIEVQDRYDDIVKEINKMSKKAVNKNKEVYQNSFYTNMKSPLAVAAETEDNFDERINQKKIEIDMYLKEHDLQHIDDRYPTTNISVEHYKKILKDNLSRDFVKKYKEKVEDTKYRYYKDKGMTDGERDFWMAYENYAVHKNMNSSNFNELFDIYFDIEMMSDEELSIAINISFTKQEEFIAAEKKNNKKYQHQVELKETELNALRSLGKTFKDDIYADTEFAYDRIKKDEDEDAKKKWSRSEGGLRQRIMIAHLEARKIGVKPWYNKKGFEKIVTKSNSAIKFKQFKKIKKMKKELANMEKAREKSGSILSLDEKYEKTKEKLKEIEPEYRRALNNYKGSLKVSLSADWYNQKIEFNRLLREMKRLKTWKFLGHRWKQGTGYGIMVEEVAKLNFNELENENTFDRAIDLNDLIDKTEVYLNSHNEDHSRWMATAQMHKFLKKFKDSIQSETAGIGGKEKHLQNVDNQIGALNNFKTKYDIGKAYFNNMEAHM